MSQKLTDLDTEFRSHHHALIGLIEDEESLAREQELLDSHDNLIADLTVRVKGVVSASSPSSTEPCRRIAFRTLTHVLKSLDLIHAIIDDDSTSDVFLLRQYEERTIDIRKDLAKTRDDLHQMELEETDELYRLQDELESQVFDCSVKFKNLLSSTDKPYEPSSSSPDTKGVKLPKLDVPTFDSNILHWRTFWEQFCISVHDRPHLSDAEKLVYLQQSLKGESAKSAIEGLSRSGECYEEAVKCLKARYDRPCLIHQTHVRLIVEAPPLKEGSGKELRRLHDAVQQHLRALKAMGCEPPGPFVTSVLELKLNQTTMFEWQKQSSNVPHYTELLGFLNLRAQASESLSGSQKKQSSTHVSFAASTSDSPLSCPICKRESHPLYAFPEFKRLPHDKQMEVVKANGLCLNCLRPGHFLKKCKSLHHCKTYQKPHHTLLHLHSPPMSSTPPSPTPTQRVDARVSSNAAANLAQTSLLMTCRLLIEAPDGTMVNARALLDSASSASFVSDHLVKGLCLPRLHQNTMISGVAGLTSNSHQALTKLTISSPQADIKFDVTAIVVPHVTCDLPVHPIAFCSTWTHLNNLSLADPDFGCPGRVDVLLGVDVFTVALLHGRRVGPPGTPVAFETVFGWVLAGAADQSTPGAIVTSHHSSVTTGDDLLRRFWEIEETMKPDSSFSPEEMSVVQHFEKNHRRASDGRFNVPLPKKPHAPPLSESRSHAVHQFLSLEGYLHGKSEFEAFDSVMQKYFDMKHAEPVPTADLEKPTHSVFYLPMYAVKKESSTTTKIRAVFDASAKLSSNVSLNDTLMVGPTVHSSLIDVLLCFRLHQIALTADVSKMYCAVRLAEADQDLHHFVWRSNTDEPLQDFRMTRVTFGVSASSFAANMSVKRNARDHTMEFPKAAKAVETAFYVNDCLTGADSVEDATNLYHQLLDLFEKGGFLLRKWNSSDSEVLCHIKPELRDVQSTHDIPIPDEYTKALGIQWNTNDDHFCLTVPSLQQTNNMTKRALVSDIAKT